jgi:hypothetical protein
MDARATSRSSSVAAREQSVGGVRTPIEIYWSIWATPEVLAKVVTIVELSMIAGGGSTESVSHAIKPGVGAGPVNASEPIPPQEENIKAGSGPGRDRTP